MIKNNKKIIIKSQKGFTLLETLIAIFILTLSITGPVYVASLAFRNTIDSRDNISAQYMAEEVIEVIKNKKDKNGLSDINISNWLNEITDNTLCLNEKDQVLNKCIMMRDLSSPDHYIFEQCLLGECPQISFNPEGEIIYGGTDVLDKSKFIREFYLQESDNETEIFIIVNIKWNDNGREKIYSLRQNLHAIPYKDFFK